MTSSQWIPTLQLEGLHAGDAAADLVSDLLDRGRDALLTPTWIAQSQKGQSQKLLMTTEREALWPMVKGLMADLLPRLNDGDARVWAGAALALLNEEPGTGVVAERVKQVLADPAATPRGHYEEGMHGYFRGVQFLIKSVFDVRLDQTWCQPIKHFVFPWQALADILDVLRAHPGLRQRWEGLDDFYTVATGQPDCVNIRHLLDLPEVRPEMVITLAAQLGVPKINRKMGIGVQGLAERFTRHGVIFEHLKETFLPDVTRDPIPRPSVYAVVNMHSLLYGFEHHGRRIPLLLDGQVAGFLDALAGARGQPTAAFFDQFLMAQHELVADLPVPEVTSLVPQLDPGVTRLDPAVRRRLNAFTANLASLLELAILSAKQPMKVVVRDLAFEPTPPAAKVYVEPVPSGFLAGLCAAGQTAADLCGRLNNRYAPGRGRFDPPPDLQAAYATLAEHAESGAALSTDSAAWQTVAPLVRTLARNPNVTADAYRHWDETEGQYFLQWCTALASFRAAAPDGATVQGGELLFVEGWNDELVPGRQEPLTNSAWRKLLRTMPLRDLKAWTIAPGIA